jgi:hypothetical protein
MKQAFVFVLLTALWAIPGLAQEEKDLATASQNPVSDLISVPFQNNTNFGIGDDDATQNILNIQPVWPLRLNNKWNLITRTIVPVISQPAVLTGGDSEFGLSDTNFSAFFSPAKPSKLIWGVGPSVLFPTATDKTLGTEKWGAGPTGVVLSINGPWVYGVLINNIWSFAGNDDRKDVNQMVLQPFVNYNLSGGWYLVSVMINTANWKADTGNKWTVPLGGGIGKIFKVGKQAVNAQVQGFYNVKKPEMGADWQFRFQFQLLFPK